MIKFTDKHGTKHEKHITSTENVWVSKNLKGGARITSIKNKEQYKNIEDLYKEKCDEDLKVKNARKETRDKL